MRGEIPAQGSRVVAVGILGKDTSTHTSFFHVPLVMHLAYLDTGHSPSRFGDHAAVGHHIDDSGVRLAQSVSVHEMR